MPVPPMQMQKSEEVARLGSQSRNLWSLLSLLWAGKSGAWQQPLWATSLPWATEGLQAELWCLGLSFSTDGTVKLNYSTGERQMGISRRDLDPGVQSGINRGQHL